MSKIKEFRPTHMNGLCVDITYNSIAFDYNKDNLRLRNNLTFDTT